MKIESNPAFPLAFDYATLKRLDSEAKETGETLFVGGLSKREYFAGLAMQGMLSSGSQATDANIAKESIGIADELIKQLNALSQVDKG